jgi:formylglycine-generating enzyme required for sulfatase activity
MAELDQRAASRATMVENNVRPAQNWVRVFTMGLTNRYSMAWITAACFAGITFIMWRTAGCTRGPRPAGSIETSGLVDGGGNSDLITQVGSQQESGTPAAEAAGKASPAQLDWAQVIDPLPDPAIIKDTTMRAAIERLKLPWRVRDKASGIEMLVVAPGSYRRGASPGDGKTPPDESPAHNVTLTRAFYLGRYEVQRSEWEHAMAGHALESDTLGMPKQGPTYSQVQQFLSNCSGLRLPTEAEWEYACRAGTAGGRYGDLRAIAWCPSTAKGAAHPVGQLAANSLGFFDMLGNVWEMCSDNYSATEYSSCMNGVQDPKGPPVGSACVLRGGSYNPNYHDDQCRASIRGLQDHEGRAYSTRGFRVARDP